MEEDLLQAVIKVEKQIQQSLEAERRKAADWLESERSAASRELQQKKKQLLNQFDQSLEKIRRQTRERAEAAGVEASLLMDYLQHVPEEILQQVVTRQLKTILPAVTGVKP